MSKYPNAEFEANVLTRVGEVVDTLEHAAYFFNGTLCVANLEDPTAKALQRYLKDCFNTKLHLSRCKLDFGAWEYLYDFA